MERTFYLLDQVRDAVQGETGLKISKVSEHDFERLLWRRATLGCEAATESGVHRVSERPAQSARFCLKFGGHIVIEGQRGAHAVMLSPRHLDVKMGASAVGFKASALLS